MRVLLLNPPAQERINRRFRCTYRARHFLFPPLEMLLLAGAAQRVPAVEPRLLDAVADQLTPEATLDAVRKFSPSLVVYLGGNDSLGDDVAFGRRIREQVDVPVLVTGYMPTLYPAEILEAGGADGVLLGEPERVFEDLLIQLSRQPGASLVDVVPDAGLALPGKPAPSAPPPDMDELPAPAYDLAPLSLYGDFFLPRPFAVLQTSRGCPFSCSYCVHPHGKQVRARSVENVLDDVRRLVHHQSVRTIRFEDDLFTLSPQRVRDFCQGLLERELNVSWTCLARPEGIDRELAELMARAGCVRVYVGIESGSSRVRKELQRGGGAEPPHPVVHALAAAGIEVAGFFIVGLPSESEEEFNASVNLAIELDLDYVVVSRARPYPGTDLFDRPPEEVEFKLLPFRTRFTDPVMAETSERRERAFYRRFYLRPRILKTLYRRLFREPRATAAALTELARSFVPAEGGAVREDLI